MKVLEKVQFNDKIALVLDEKPGNFLYSFLPGYRKKYIVGHDETKTFYDCYYYDRPSKGFYAFAGREFDLQMKDGTSVHCYGQYWCGGLKKIGEIIGVDLISFTARSIDQLFECYVFCSYQGDMSKISELINGCTSDVIPYWDYKKILRNKKAKMDKLKWKQ